MMSAQRHAVRQSWQTRRKGSDIGFRVWAFGIRSLPKTPVREIYRENEGYPMS